MKPGNFLGAVCLFVSVLQLGGADDRCKKGFPIPPDGYKTRCGTIIKSCGDNPEKHPHNPNCTNFLECHKDRIHICPCAGGNHFVTKERKCIYTVAANPCHCPVIVPLTTTSESTPVSTAIVVEPTGTVAPTGEMESGLSPTALYIIGSAAGGVVIIILLVTVIVLCCRMRRSRLDKNIAIVENPEYTKRHSAIYSEIEDNGSDPPPGNQINRFSTFQPVASYPTSTGGAVSNATSAPQQDVDNDAHEYQQLLQLQPKPPEVSRQQSGSRDKLERSESEEAAYMVTPLVGPPQRTTSREVPNEIPMNSLSTMDEVPESDPQSHEYFILEGPN